MSWLYNNEEITELPECIGFVYKITNLISNRAYIGKKLSHFAKISVKTVTLKSGLKKKKKTKTHVESDWKKYWSSSVELQNDVKSLGEENFKREILMFAHSKGSLSYLELREQILHDVLLHQDLWYNGFVGGKIHRNHIKDLIILK